METTTYMDIPKIEWEFFFGFRSKGAYNRYEKAEINGKRVEKYSFRGGVKYSIGNMDEAKKKYKTEIELYEACYA